MAIANGEPYDEMRCNVEVSSGEKLISRYARDYKARICLLVLCAAQVLSMNLLTPPKDFSREAQAICYMLGRPNKRGDKS